MIVVRFAFVVVILAACEPRVPSELRPVAASITELPANFCGTTLDFDFSLKNIGDDAIELEVVIFEDVAPTATSFHDPIFADTTIPAGEDGFVQFRYETPEGVAQTANMIITSNAAVNPRLVIPMSTVAFPPPDNAAEICAQ
jgi:hypothetical protein